MFTMQRITIPEIMEDEWFKKGYSPAKFVEEDDDTCLDNVDATNSEVCSNKIKKCI